MVRHVHAQPQSQIPSFKLESQYLVGSFWKFPRRIWRETLGLDQESSRSTAMKREKLWNQKWE
jgi:hypothetical protein